jgi:hypothetical protein
MEVQADMRSVRFAVVHKRDVGATRSLARRLELLATMRLVEESSYAQRRQSAGSTALHAAQGGHAMIFCCARVPRTHVAAAATRDCKEVTTMGEQQTMSILAWMVGWIVAITFILDAISLPHV